VHIAGLDREAAGDLAVEGVDYSQGFVDVRFGRAETWSMLEVSCLFDPAADAIYSSEELSVAESDRHVTSVQG